MACARNEVESLLLKSPYSVVIDCAHLGWEIPFGVAIGSDLHDVGPGQLRILEPELSKRTWPFHFGTNISQTAMGSRSSKRKTSDF